MALIEIHSLELGRGVGQFLHSAIVVKIGLNVPRRPVGLVCNAAPDRWTNGRSQRLVLS